MHLTLRLGRGAAAGPLLACAILACETALAQSTCKVAHLTASDGAGFENFGESVAVSGQTAIAGAVFHAHGGLNTGAVYVFALEGSSWLQAQELFPADGQG